MSTSEPRRAPALPHALDQPGALERALGGREPLVFLDYDGTLCPIVSRPELAVLSEPMRASVARLAGRHPLGVISGRQLADLRRRVGRDDLYYGGNHGFEIEGPAGSELRWEVGTEYVDEVDRLQRRLAGALARIEGVIVEHKRYSLSVHYRLVAEDAVPALTREVEQAVRAFPRLRLRHGKKVLEVRPDLDWHKGKALRWLLDHIGRPAQIPLFIGDDLTDEDAFAEIAADGVGILVSEEPRETAARLWLRDVDEVATLLDRLATL